MSTVRFRPEPPERESPSEEGLFLWRCILELLVLFWYNCVTVLTLILIYEPDFGVTAINFNVKDLLKKTVHHRTITLE